MVHVIWCAAIIFIGVEKSNVLYVIQKPGTPELTIRPKSGAGNLEGWRQIAELAKVLNAALGSTRPAFDEGWCGLETMI